MSEAMQMTTTPVESGPAAFPGFTLERQASGQLLFTNSKGEQHTGVVPVRAFPIAAPDEGISLVSTEGREVVWIPQLQELPPAERALLQEDLALRDFVPEILRLKSVSTFATPSIWAVETDRGNTTFVLKGEEDIRRLGRTALMIAGGDGVQYSIRDMSALDRGSRKLLERFL
jgi:hypothetical protein